MTTFSLRTARTDALGESARESMAGGWVALCLTGFFMGFHMMWNDWFHVGWFVGTAIPALVLTNWSRQWPLIKGNSVMRWSAVFLLWMTGRSLMTAPYLVSATPLEVGNWLFGAVTLAGFALLIGLAAENPLVLPRAGLYTGFAAALTAILSVLLFAFILPGHGWGGRLQNWFIYGGLHPVGTGLRYGFAALWLACLHGKLRSRTERLWVLLALTMLLTAVFLTLSRGALLALTVGHATLLLAGGWQRTRTVCSLFLGVMLMMQLGAPLFKKAMETSTIFSPANAHVSQGPVLERNPAKEFWQRWDNGRFMLYSAAWQTLDDRSSKLIGIGEWGTDERWRSRVSWEPAHLHSAFLATFVHGGAIGLLLLLTLLFKGFRCAGALAQRGDPTWLALLAYGCTGLMFDGQTLSSLTSVPRVEPLLVWLPLIASVAVFQSRSHVSEPRHE